MLSYSKYEPLLQKAIRSALRKNPLLDPADLQARVDDAYLDAIKSWDPNKGKFITHLVWKIYARFKKAPCIKEPIDIGPFVKDGNNRDFLENSIQIVSGDNPLSSLMLKDSIKWLTRKARIIVGLVLTPPLDFKKEYKNVSRNSIQCYLRTKGWTRKEVDHYMIEIKRVLEDNGEIGRASCRERV